MAVPTLQAPSPVSSSLQSVLDDMFSQVNQQQQQQPGSNKRSSSSPVCVSSSGTQVLPARVAAAPSPLQLQFSGATSRAAAASAAQAAAQQAALLNADAGRVAEYANGQVSCSNIATPGGCLYSEV